MGNGFKKLDGTVTKMAMGTEALAANIKHAATLSLPKLEDVPGFRQRKNYPISLLAGGPSLADTIKDAKGDLMVCGSAHDYVLSLGVKPKYAVFLDGDAIMAKYVKNPCKDVIYLVATQCDPVLFDRLKSYKVYTWNCAGGVGYELFNNELVVGGGSTVTLRALSLAVLLGFSDIHTHGMDSCYIGGKHHAYSTEKVAKARPIRVGGATGKTFMASPYQVSQAMNFQAFLRHFKHIAYVTVHGPGLIAEIMKQGAKNSETLTHKERSTMHDKHMEEVIDVAAVITKKFNAPPLEPHKGEDL